MRFPGGVVSKVHGAALRCLKDKTMSSVKELILRKVNWAFGNFETVQESHDARRVHGWYGHADLAEVEINFMNMLSKDEIDDLTGIEDFEDRFMQGQFDLDIDTIVEDLDEEQAATILEMMKGQQEGWYSSDEWQVHASRK